MPKTILDWSSNNFQSFKKGWKISKNETFIKTVCLLLQFKNSKKRKIEEMDEIKKDSREEIEELETREWLESLEFVLQASGPERVKQLLLDLDTYAHEAGVELPFTANTSERLLSADYSWSPKTAYTAFLSLFNCTWCPTPSRQRCFYVSCARRRVQSSFQV